MLNKTAKVYESASKQEAANPRTEQLEQAIRAMWPVFQAAIEWVERGRPRELIAFEAAVREARECRDLDPTTISTILRVVEDKNGKA